MSFKPQHLTLSVSPKGKVHFVIAFPFEAICRTSSEYEPWIMVVGFRWNRYSRPVTCQRCLAEMKKRGWEVPK